jgi:hypothetical protein
MEVMRIDPTRWFHQPHYMVLNFAIDGQNGGDDLSRQIRNRLRAGVPEGTVNPFRMRARASRPLRATVSDAGACFQAIARHN